MKQATRPKQADTTRIPVFSVTLDDCEVQSFTVGGAGGQHRDRARTGIRIIHRPSEARGESREHREQLANKREAFIRMAKSPNFRFWASEERKRREGELTAAERIAAELADPNITRVEVLRDGEWAIEGSSRDAR